MKISSLIIGILMASILFVTMGNFIVELSNNYDVQYNNTDLEFFNKINETYDTSQTLQSQTNSTGVSSQSVFDILGNLVNKGLNTLKVTYSSISTADAMLNKATNTIGLPSYIYRALTTALIIGIFLTVVIGAYLKWRV